MSNWKWSVLKLSDSVKGEVKRVKYVEFNFAIKITGNAPASSNGYRKRYYHLVKKKVPFKNSVSQQQAK